VEHTSDSPGVAVFPPLLFAGTLMLGLVLHWIRPVPLLPSLVARLPGLVILREMGKGQVAPACGRCGGPVGDGAPARRYRAWRREREEAQGASPRLSGGRQCQLLRGRVPPVGGGARAAVTPLPPPRQQGPAHRDISGDEPPTARRCRLMSQAPPPRSSRQSRARA
jgi:hypothetical protein